MKKKKRFRFGIIAATLVLGLWWSMASVSSQAQSSAYPKDGYVTTTEWLKTHLTDDKIVIVDVREDKHFDGKVIVGALRLPWGLFRFNDTAHDLGGLFVGTKHAQEVLGAHGIARNDTIVLYDSVTRDGGATASYIFWVLDLLGHKNMKVLDGGIDAWIASGGKISSDPVKLPPILYQAPMREINSRRLGNGDFIYQRLGDPYYQILDVRSQKEYLGEKPNVSLDGTVLRLGHIPTAVNVDYQLNWINPETKKLKSYPELQELYRGLDPSKAVITYCHSGRRSSFTYFALRIMGFQDIILYDRSWNEWGNPRFFFPVETKRNLLSGTELPQAITSARETVRTEPSTKKISSEATIQTGNNGYISCGG